MSLKYRIAIGKLENGEWKFDHYASEAGMEYLSPKYDGSGVMLAKCHEVTEYNTIGQEVNWILVLDGYQDVSDTHRVEWGIKTYDKHGDPLDIYDGDIFVDWNTGADGVSTRPIIFELLTCASCVSYDEFPMIEILGNVNENPECTVCDTLSGKSIDGKYCTYCGKNKLDSFHEYNGKFIESKIIKGEYNNAK